MKIAIIGGGFYGCYFAYKILQLKKKHQITIFEKNNDILSEAAINNQYRLHKGFHYPRSQNTIKQTNQGFKFFSKEFKNFIYFPKINIYAIHRNSKINFNKYLNIFKKDNFKFKILPKEKFNLYFVKPNEIEGAIMVDEAVIKIEKLYKYIRSKLKDVEIFKNTEICKIDRNKKIILYKNKEKKFDLIINTTFTKPNLGLKKKKYKIKYELASMLHVKNFLNKDTALTVMDGNFGSAYPINQNVLTLSSVKYTPFKKFKTIKNYSKFIHKKSFLKKLNDHSYKILRDISKYILVPKNIKLLKVTFAPKVKIINDLGDQRLSLVTIEDNFVSVLCGKLDAVYLSWKKIRLKFFL